MVPIPFAHWARRPCRGHADLALALAAEFRPPLRAAHAALDELARTLAPARRESAGDQLAACAELLGARLACTTFEWSGIDDLL
jgi:hypothetical protein